MKVGEEVRGYGRTGSTRRLLVDPAYTPDIAHLVHRGTGPPQPSSQQTKSARARLAEVLSLTRTATRLRQATQRKGSQVVTERGYYVGDSRQASITKEPERKTSTRGANVSVLHLRSVSEPWEAKTSVYSTPASYPNYSHYPSSQYSRRVAREGSLNVDPCSRELSPVRWQDREVDGVYLGRSGWVQVQQNSQESRDSQQLQIQLLAEQKYIQKQQQQYKMELAQQKQQQQQQRQNVTRIKMADYHCSKSEPGTLVEPQRPGYLPLPGGPRRGRVSPSSLDLSREEPITPPPPTPIISPPPAFQDSKFRREVSPRRNAPFLSRSNAIEISPPPSPPKSFHLSPNTHTQILNSRRRVSPVGPPQQTKSLENPSGRRSIFQKKDSSSSSSSSFGFRSLDSSVVAMRPNVMPRLKEAFTDSSFGGYESGGDEESLNTSEYSTVRLINSPDIERISPSGRSRQRTRRSPCQEQVMKNGSPGSSSTSSAESGPFRRSGSAHNTPRGRSPRNVPTPVDLYHPPSITINNDRSGKVRRSRSLQLPERSSPSGYHPNPQQVLANSRASRQSGYYRNVSKESEERDEPDLDEELFLLREAEQEARVVTEFVQGIRSRDAARNLLHYRFTSRDEGPPTITPQNQNVPGVVLVRPQRDRQLQRGVTAPARYQQSSLPHQSASCDYWPQCIHSMKQKQPPQPNLVPNMRLSHSYPNQQQQRAPGYSAREFASRSSPASLDRVNDTSPRSRRGKSLVVTPSEDIEINRRNRFRRSPDRYDDRSYDRGCLEPTPNDSPKVSPANSYPSNSSSSTDAWLNRRTLGVANGGRSPEDRPGSAPAEQRNARGPSVRVENTQRSLSLPKCFQSGREIPRSHASTVQHYHPPSRMQQYNGAPWGRRAGANSPSPVPHTIRSQTPEVARTAPPTPVKELVYNEKSGGLSKSAKFSSTPLLDPGSDWDLSRQWTDDDKDSKNGDVVNRFADNKTLSQSQRNISESVISKFRKSFSLRFYKSKGNGGDSGKEEEEEPPPLLFDPPESPSPPPETPAVNQSQTQQQCFTREDNSSQEKFRIGPLVWRSSKERKKGKKAARSAKCNSGDSGIQIEIVGRTAGDSSESHDTDNLADDENVDDLDSPRVVRRRGTASSSEGRPSRPTSDVINQFLIDRLKAELEARGLRKRGQMGVRRTYSDLGGQRLYNWEMRRGYRRMISHPAPLRAKPNREHSLSNNSNTSRNWRRTYGRPSHLRRSVSQPLGINELSPLMLRKTTGGRANVLSEDERGGGGTSEDEMLSDSESSIASLTDRKKSFELKTYFQAMDEEVVILAEAVWDHVAMEPEELAFRAGDVIEVVDTYDKDWWWGAKGQQTGWFPSAFVRLRVSQEDTVEDCLAAVAAGKGTKTLRRRVSVSLLSNDQVRSRVITELINTERDFVKLLRDVQEGYLTECRRRTDMFSEDQLKVIFSNLEDLLEFQDRFLIDLEATVDWEAPYKTCVADVFLKHRAGFRMYSEYCNSHPMAIATLQELYRHNGYDKFFEACRLMRGLMEIPLDGYLLTPVQRICKYPLQLAELLKYTKTDHEDYEKIKEALEGMRGVAVLINERKRRMESLEKLALWQARVEGWEGDDLIETSTQLIHQGEGIKVTSGMWTSNIFLFLFDHQLVYCKKDILKRNTYVYKGRINMNNSEVVSINDGKDAATGVTVRHCIKVQSILLGGSVTPQTPKENKALMFCLRSAKEKTDWLEAFSQERLLVEKDFVDGLELAPAARRLARSAAARLTSGGVRPPRKPGKVYKRGASDSAVLDLSNAPAPPAPNPSLGRRVGTWFTFGGGKKSSGRGGVGRITPPRSVVTSSSGS